MPINVLINLLHYLKIFFRIDHGYTFQVVHGTQTATIRSAWTNGLAVHPVGELPITLQVCSMLSLLNFTSSHWCHLRRFFVWSFDASYVDARCISIIIPGSNLDVNCIRH